MTNFSSYPHFVADQVLTASHLNGIFNYLDEQNRLTRNKLLGIGIVCGLEYETPSSNIVVSKGNGITSAGFLITENSNTYTHYRPTAYELPDDFLEIESDYGYPYALWKNHAYELLPNATSTVKATDVAISSNLAFLNDKILVYVLEKKTTDLKNCTSNDCDDKGERVDFTLKPLLVDKSIIDAAGNLFSNSAKIFPDVDFRRLYLPSATNVDADDVFESFKTVFSDSVTLQQLEAGLDKIYLNFSPLFPVPNAINPFSGFAAAFPLNCAAVLNTNKFMFQYLYDWLDDLIKAYYEFVNCASEIISECCPSEALFPMHLLLGEASKSSQTTNAAYRSQFIFSPLFQQNNVSRNKLQSLILRLVKMYKNYQLFTIQEMRIQNIEITPSNWTRALLSERCIPFYYEIDEVLLPWNYKLSSLGKERRNLSYNSDIYSGEDPILNPLDYDIEKYDFYRIEGHIGKRITTAFKNVTTLRDDYNLGFDVVALNLNVSNLNLKTISEEHLMCTFKDIESAYRMAVTGLLEDLHRSMCFVTHLPFYQIERKTPLDSMVGNSGATPANQAETNNATKEFLESMIGGCFKHSNTLNYSEYLDDKEENGYNRGNYISEIFSPIPATVGKLYLDNVANNTAIPAPGFPAGLTITAMLDAFYNRALNFIDVVEKMIAQLCDETYLSELDENSLYVKIHAMEALVNQLKQELLLIMGLLATITKEDDKKNTHLPEFILDLEFDLFVDELEMILDMGFEEKIQTLINELNKRKKQVAMQFTLGGYLSSHHGLEHKAGVPRGGTFVMLYSYIPENKNPNNPDNPDNPEEDPDFPCDDEKINWGRRKKRRKNYYSEYVNGYAEDSKETEYINDRYKRKGTVFADFYLPYLCCGGCGSPVTINEKERNPKLETRTLYRTVKWGEELSLSEIVKETASDAALANIEQIADPGGLNIVNGKIIDAPKINNQYTIKFYSKVGTETIGVRLILNIKVDKKGKPRKIASNASACVLNDKINLLELVKSTELTTVESIASTDGLIFDEQYNIMNKPSEDLSKTLVIEGKTALSEPVELTLNIDFYRPKIDMTLTVKFNSQSSAISFNGKIKSFGAGHKTNLRAIITDGTTTIDLENNSVIDVEKIIFKRINSLECTVNVGKLDYLSFTAFQNNMNPELIGVMFLGSDEIEKFPNSCALETRSDLFNVPFIRENQESLIKGKTFNYIK